MLYAIRPLADATEIDVPPALLSDRPETVERRAAYGLLNELMADAGFGTIRDLRKDALGRPVHPGRPDLWLSVAHTAGAVAAAVTAGGRIGIDVEAATPYDPEIADLVLTPDQRRMVETADDPDRVFLWFWVRKEALGKAAGVGIDDPVLAAAVECQQLGLAGRDFSLEDLEAPDGVYAALATAD